MANLYDLNQRIDNFSKLGNILSHFCSRPDEANQPFHTSLRTAISKSCATNPWFTPKNYLLAIKNIASLLSDQKIHRWLNNYPDLLNRNEPKKIAVIMAGNIPLVGFHDFLCTLISNQILIGKLSHNDSFVLPVIAEILNDINPHFKDKIFFTNQIQNFDAIISTGSNNSARYFEYQFNKYPHIIRKNRNSIAIISPETTKEDLKKLSFDLYQYYGLGCRNISKIFIHKQLDLQKIINQQPNFFELNNNPKYHNNYRYHKTILKLNNQPFIDTGFSLFTENSSYASPIATYHYEYYNNTDLVWQNIESNFDQIQCIVCNFNHPKYKTINFGNTQLPQLEDYADNIDTMNFILNL